MFRPPIVKRQGAHIEANCGRRHRLFERSRSRRSKNVRDERNPVIHWPNYNRQCASLKVRYGGHAVCRGSPMSARAGL